jgi:methyltransferase
MDRWWIIRATLTPAKEARVPGYVIMNAEVTDPAGYEEFKRLAEVAISEHGGRYLVRGGALDVLEGDWHPRLVLLEFDSLEAALGFYHSDGYQAARELRLRTATARVAAVDGVEDERRRMEDLIRTYFAACNAADVEGIAACFVPDAVHYFPPGMYDGPFRGARTIAERWRGAVETLGSYWTIDRLVADPATHQAVIEWTHFKTKQGKVLRGDEWYRFEASSGLIKEIRAYYASPQDPSLDRLELGGYDYAANGYALEPPPGER